MMLSVRKEGRSFGPITYEFTGAKGRTNLLAFVLFYLIIISATFIALIASFWNAFPGTFVATLGILLAGLLCGQLLYRIKMNVFAVTGIGLALVVLSIYLGVLFPISLPWGAWNLPVWAFICAIILYAAAVLPTPMFIQPTNYLAFYPAYAAIILILVGAVITPFTNTTIQMPAGPFLFDPQGILGPIWPILFVAIACGAISGWHSLVSSSSSSKQLDIETDALPVGGGAMLSEGLLALASLIAYMVLAPSFFVGRTNVTAWVQGAVVLTTPILGGLTAAVLRTFFGLVLIIYALTVQALVTRFFRLVAGETWGESRFRALGNKHVSTVVGLGVPWGFAVSGSWWALWLYFGGANQLLAGLAIMLITIHLARVRAPTRYSLIPGVFMVVTTLSALVWQTGTFLYSVWAYIQKDNTWVLRNVRGPIQTDPNLLIVAVAINGIFVVVGAVLFAVGVSMAIRLFRSYSRSVAEARGKAPAAADGGTREEESP
jgi:carbon starvation protein